MFGVVLVPSLFLLVHFFLLVLGLGFKGEVLLILGSWVVFLGFGLLLVSSCSSVVSSCSVLLLGGLGGFPGVWAFSCPSLVSSCSFYSCFGGLGDLPVLVSSCSVLVYFFALVLGLGFRRRFVLILGAWVVFLVFGVVIVPSLSLLVDFFLIGSGFRV